MHISQSLSSRIHSCEMEGLFMAWADHQATTMPAVAYRA